MVTLEVRLPMTFEVKKPDSCRLRCSKARKPNVVSFAIGKPSVAPYCARVKGAFLSGSLSMTGAKGLRAWMVLWRMKPKTLPRTSLVPDLVTTLTTPPEVRPNSGANELVTTWNSCTASCETVERAALTELSVLSAPSTCTRFERPRWPPKLRPEVGAGPMGRPLSRVTVEVVRVKLM